MQQILDLLAMPETQTLLIGAVALIVGVLKRRETVKRWQLEKALECLEAGVRDTYEEYVRAIKTASADGKLTDAERAEARRRALERAKDYAASEGVELAKHYAKAYLPVLVEKLVRRGKAEAALPFAFSDGPELPSLSAP